MLFNKDIFGADDGGSSQSPRTPVEGVDTLQSTAMVSFIDLLGEGEIGGLVNGAQSIYLDGTPLENSNGDRNFAGVTWDQRTGRQLQSPFSGFDDIASPTSVSVKIMKDMSYTFAVSNPNTDSVRLIMSVPTLASLDATTGDTGGTVVQYTIEVSTSGGEFKSALADTTYTPGGTWGTSSGYLSATKSVGATSLKAGIVLVGNAGTVVVQPQYLKSGVWSDLGSRATLTATGVMPTAATGYSSEGGLSWQASIDAENAAQVAAFIAKAPTCWVIAPGDSEAIRFVVVSASAIPTSVDENGNILTTTPASIAASGINSLVATSTCTISGKTRSKYQRSHLINMPTGTSWIIRVSRITPDSVSSALVNEIWVDSYIEIVNSKLSYPNSALVSMGIDSAQFNRIPTRSYLVNGLYIQVPQNYDPLTKEYTGIWDGTLKVAISDNPAWILYDILTNKRYGLGEFIGASMIDKSRLYAIGKYCDEQVDDGYGGKESRFRVNTVIQTQAEAYKLVTDLSSVFRGMTYWSGSQVGFAQDSPTDPTMIYSPANVIGGDFQYTGTARKDRHSVVMVTWNDPENQYMQQIEYVEDAELINSFGVRKFETVAFGCTSRGQANRAGRWILYTEKCESNFVTFSVGVDSALVAPGEIIRIQDPTRAGQRMAGRVAAATTTQATLDAPVVISNTNAVFSVRLADGTFVDRTILQDVGTWATVTWSSALTVSPEPGAMFIVSEANLVPMLARVLGVSEVTGKATEYQIAAVEHYPQKFALIDKGISFEIQATVSLNALSTPTNLVLTDYIYATSTNISSMLDISWEDNQPRVTAWDVSVREPNGAWVTQRVSSPGFSVPNVRDGTSYEVSILAVNSLGRKSTTALVGTHVVIGKNYPPATVTNLTATYVAGGVGLKWSSVPDIDLRCYEVREGASWDTATVLTQTTDNFFQLPAQVAGVHAYQVCAFDTTGHYSAVSATASTAVTAPLAPTGLAVTSVGTGFSFSWGAVSGPQNITGYRIKLGAAVIDTVSALTYSVQATWLGDREFSVEAVDAAGNVGTASVITATVIAPVAPTGLTAAIKGVSYVLSWTAVTGALSMVGYRVSINGVPVDVANSLTYSLPIIWQGSRLVSIAAIDFAGNVGAAATVDAAVNTPAAPTGLMVSFAGDQYSLAWVASQSDASIDGYEVRAGGASWSDATYLGNVSALVFKAKVDWAGTETMRVKAISVSGYYGVEATIAAVVLLPIAPVFSATSFVGQSAKLRWQNCQASLPIASYEVREGASWAAGTPVGTLTAETITVIGNWVGLKTYWAAAKDSAGNVGPAGSATVVISLPDSPLITTLISGANIVLNWTSGATSIPIESYEVRIGSSWATGFSYGLVSGTTFSTKINWSNTTNVYVMASDVADNSGVPGTTSVTISLPGTPVVSGAVSGNQTALSWTATQGTLPIDSYEIRYGSEAWAAATPVSVIKSNMALLPVSWTGDRQYQIAAIDLAGNISPIGLRTITVSPPAAPSVSASFLSDQFKLAWVTPASTLAIEDYEVRYGAAWVGATSVGTIKGTSYTISAQWAGMRRWWVAAKDVNGNVGAPSSSDVTIVAPSAPSVTQQVVDNNVLLYWTQATGTLPIDTYEIRRGSTWALGGNTVSIGTKSGGFTTIFETTSGTYTYWVCAIDTAGNFGTPSSVGATVSQPPDYILKVNVFSVFDGTKTNMVLDGSGSWVLPVSASETFSGHFANHLPVAWSTPQDQINAGLPIYVQPALVGAGSYEEFMDYGQILPTSKVSISLTGAVVSGTPVVSTTIKVSLDNVTWTTYSNVSQAFASNFRYVKVSVVVTAATTLDLYSLSSFNYRLDSKLKNDSGMGTASASDAVTGNNAVINGITVNLSNPTINGVSVPDGAGTLVTFSVPFLDISSLDVSIATGSTARYALYDFLDVPGATGLKVILYDGSGTRVGGNFSWSCKGY